jgi:hypothetical protein
VTNVAFDFDASPTGRVLAWIDILDPGTQTSVFGTLMFFGPVEWTAGVRRPSTDEELPARWAVVRDRIEREAAQSPFRNVGVALCLRALLTFNLGRLASETAEGQANVQRDLLKLVVPPEQFELVEKQLEEVPLEHARLRRKNDEWLHLVDAHLSDERLMQLLRGVTIG